MSKGPRPRVDPVPRPVVPRPRPSPPAPDQPCAGPHEVTFSPAAGAAVGLGIILVPSGHELVLMADAARVGRLRAGRQFGQIAGCIGDGWVFAGVITQLSEAVGEVVVGGEPGR
jgi:hypothetical protein